MAVAGPMRTAWPARQPSPKESPGPSMATTACLPDVDSTDRVTPHRRQPQGAWVLKGPARE